MIKTFADKQTASVFRGLPTSQFDRSLAKAARKKLELIAAAASIEFLRSPPGNRLEALSGDRAGQWSIRINKQWRICFRFESGNAYDVEIVDYH